jgi:hypothetical protein
MSEDLYSPPRAELDTATAPVGTGDFDIGRCFSEAWAATWANFPLWLGALLVWSLAVGLATVTVIGIFLLVPVLIWGGVRFFLAMHDREAEFSDLFAGFSRYGEALVSMLVFALAMFLLQLVAQALSAIGSALDSGVLIGVGYLAGIAFSAAVISRFEFAAFLIVDRRMPASEALGRAWSLTQPLVWKVVGLVLLSYAVILGGLLAFIVGVIPATVIAYLMRASAYRQMVGGPARG